jgi:pilus assembly protein CpaE
MVEITKLVKIEASNQSLKNTFEDIILSTKGFQLQSENDTQRSDLLIFELSDDIEKDFELIQSLLSSDAVGEVFLTSVNADSAMLMKAIKSGAKEFFSQPLDENEIRQALEGLQKRERETDQKIPTQPGKIIDIVGTKGGVGTTTIAVNVAVSLADKKYGKSVALIDMNTLFGDIPLFLSLEPSYHWGEITQNIDRLDPTFLMNILSRHSSGVHVLPAPAYLNGYPATTPTIMRHLLGHMQRMFDFIVIDGGISINDTSLSVIENSNDVLLVSLLNLACLSNTNKVLKSLNSMGFLPKEHIRVVANRCLKSADVSPADAADSIDQEIFWTIPNDYKMTMSAINQGEAITEIAAKTPVGKNLKELADVLLKGDEKRKKKRRNFLGMF